MDEVSESSRERETHCPICWQTILLEFCDPRGVALCPRCGLLLRRFQERLAPLFGASDAIQVATSFAKDLGADSFDIIEIVVELEKEFGVRILEVEAKQIETVADAIRCILRRLEKGADESDTTDG